jgi:hypothetical protein
MATFTLVLILIGFLLVLSYIKNLDEEIRDLKKYVGTLERPMPACNFNSNHRKPKPQSGDFKNEIQKR